MAPPKATKDDLWNTAITDLETGCWVWQGARSPSGYGTCTRSGRFKRAHRLAYEYINGSVPDGLSVLHKCDNRACINPTHLFLGTHQDNMTDMRTKGRQAVGARARNHRRLETSQVVEIKQMLSEGVRGRRAAERFGVSDATISQIKSRKYWSDV